MEVSTSLSFSVSDLNSKIAHIANAGNPPEDWKDLIDQVKLLVDTNDKSKHVRTVDKLYGHAFKVIPTNNNSIVRAQLFLDYAEFRSLNATHDSLAEAEKVLSYAHRKLRQFAIVHIACAELEIKKGNRDKALEILQQASSLGAQPLSLINKALERFAEGKTKLLKYEENDESCNNLSPVSSQDSSEEWSNSLFGKSFGQNKETFEWNPSHYQPDTGKLEQDIENIPPCRLESHPQESHCDRNPLSLTSFRSFSGLPETPNSTHNLPSSTQKRLNHHHSTPNLMPMPDNGSKQSASKPHFYGLKTALGPPMRVKVNTALKNWSEGENRNTIDFPSGSVFGPCPSTEKTSGPSPDRKDTETIPEASIFQSSESKCSTKVLSHFTSHPVLPSTKVSTNQESESMMHNSVIKTLNTNSGQPLGLQRLDSTSDFGHRMPNAGFGSKADELSTSLKPITIPKPNVSASDKLSRTGNNSYSATSMETIREKRDTNPVCSHKPESNTFTEERRTDTACNSATYSVHSFAASGTAIAAPVIPPAIVNQKVKYVNGVPYNVLRLIGRGGSAKVYQVFDPVANNIRALKIVDLQSVGTTIRDGYLNEIRLLKKLQSCDLVIKLFDSEYNENEKKLFAVLEYGETDLEKVIGQKETKKIDAFTVGHYWKQMVEAVHAMHQESVIHSDLKPANFLLVSGKVKLIDFGIANAIQNDCTSIIKEEKIGTPSYMSPESLMEINGIAKFKIGKKSDVWSLGCILYQMVYGHTPFQFLPMREKLNAIVNPSYIIPFPDTGEPALMDVLKKCLTREVADRPTTDGVLNHPYLKRNAPQGGANSLPNVEPALRLLREKLAGISPGKQELSLRRMLDIVDGKNSNT
ncbi:hypothetical protein Btru_062627 [Bulinus truncatus]|nr:hypothetical protein Btru_062627 [Bulinus truncatus]